MNALSVVMVMSKDRREEEKKEDVCTCKLEFATYEKICGSDDIQSLTHVHLKMFSWRIGAFLMPMSNFSMIFAMQYLFL